MPSNENARSSLFGSLPPPSLYRAGEKEREESRQNERRVFLSRSLPPQSLSVLDPLPLSPSSVGEI